MIVRDLDDAQNRSYDMIVVGGGIYGIAHLLEASRRGLSACLVERGDFGAETSSNSLRIVHGGLRYLQSADLPRFFESVRERTWFLRHFPDLVRPLPCLMPLYGRGVHRTSVLRAALAANDLLSLHRNRGLDEQQAIPRGRVLSPDEAQGLFPGIEVAGLQGAALWYDAVAPRAERLTMEMLRWAATGDVTALNYVEASALDTRDQKVEGIEARDVQTGRSLRLRAPLVINCAGPWCREVARHFHRDIPELFQPSVALNLALARKALSDAALAVRAPRPRAPALFLCSRHGEIVAGTYHAAWKQPQEGLEAEGEALRSLVGEFLTELNAALPGQDFVAEDVRKVFWGFLPAKTHGSSQLAVRARICDHHQLGGPKGLWSVSGVKLTTSRAIAEKTLRSAYSRVGRKLSPASSARPAPLPVPEASELPGCLRSDEQEVRALVTRLVEEESVLQLQDLLLRRTDWGNDPCFEPSQAHKVAALAGLADLG